MISTYRSIPVLGEGGWATEQMLKRDLFYLLGFVTLPFPTIAFALSRKERCQTWQCQWSNAVLVGAKIGWEFPTEEQRCALWHRNQCQHQQHTWKCANIQRSETSVLFLLVLNFGWESSISWFQIKFKPPSSSIHQSLPNDSNRLCWSEKHCCWKISNIRPFFVK